MFDPVSITTLSSELRLLVGFRIVHFRVISFPIGGVTIDLLSVNVTVPENPGPSRLVRWNSAAD